MIVPLRRVVRGVGLALARAIGTHLVDFKTGHSLGRALVVPWRGKIHIIGLVQAVRPVFLPQKRVTYWKQVLGFTVHEPPDFERLKPDAPKRAEKQG
jgi:hypothetical protein